MTSSERKKQKLMIHTTAPSPKTATYESVSTLQVLQTSPKPVATPPPNKQAFSKGASFGILAQEISDSTAVYSAVVVHHMTWYISCS
jgi:hypothetical protein